MQDNPYTKLFGMQILYKRNTCDMWIRYSKDSITTWSDWKQFSQTDHKHSADDITSGILGLERGGLGADTAEGARTNIGAAAASHNHVADDITGILSLANGGLGVDASGSDKTKVLENLGISSKTGYSNGQGSIKIGDVLICWDSVSLDSGVTSASVIGFPGQNSGYGSTEYILLFSRIGGGTVSSYTRFSSYFNITVSSVSTSTIVSWISIGKVS